ncbi:MAG TPA: hypothetical protein VFQ51_08595 [Vicinamibacteria bacterium]|nr:hypothetical protein [Vicinamibacteria bacterium]
MDEPVRTVEDVARERHDREDASEDRSDGDLLLPSDRRDDLRRVWTDVQTSFIDEPQDAVRKADGLVQDVLRSVAEGFESARRSLEGEWQRGEHANTESLRLAFRRYRALFERLLSA